jgi:glycerol-3-phosphate dehydrogenase
VTPFDRFDRGAALARLGAGAFDVLVIGGGVTGAGVALDAASRGLRTAIVERDDWASGTSSKSSKLVHGGLRYLQQREYGLVFENLAERQHLLDNAPHLVTELPFLIPLLGKDGAVNAAVAKGYSTALWLYDAVGGIRIGKRHRRISRSEALAHFPALRADRVAAAFLYYDARTDDARLTLALARTAVLDHGAVASNYAGVRSLLKDASGQVTGAVLADGTNVRASSVVNATGVWADDVRALDEGAHPHTIRPAKGIHVAVPADRLPCDIAAVVPVPKDRRSIFVVPWGTQTYVGTTDTDYDGPLDDPSCTAEDVAYLLGAVNAATTAALTRADVSATWAGLRPLVRNASTERTADLSRRHQVHVAPSGLVTVTGGKLTTYRKMAADVLDAIVPRRSRTVSCTRSRTRKLPLRGAVGLAYLRQPGVAARLGVTDEVLAHLSSRYGSEAPRVLALARGDASLLEPLVAGLPYVRVEAVWAAREEMAVTLDDVLSRRTRALLHDRDATAAAAPSVASLLAPVLGWSAAEAASQCTAFEERVARERACAAP